MVAIKSARLTGDCEEEEEELEVVVEKRWVPMWEARKVEDSGAQASQRDEPMADGAATVATDDL
eukprot:127727-Lingulodinium_polyedra.AAC.1